MTTSIQAQGHGTPAIIKYQVASGTNGGSTAVGVVTRPLNVVQSDIDDIITLTSNQIVIKESGLYKIGFSAATCIVADGTHISSAVDYLHNVTTGVDMVIGMPVVNTYTSSNDLTLTRSCNVSGIVTLAADDVIELRNKSSRASANVGLGSPASLSIDEVYATVEIQRLA